MIYFASYILVSLASFLVLIIINRKYYTLNQKKKKRYKNHKLPKLKKIENQKNSNTKNEMYSNIFIHFILFEKVKRSY